MATVLAKALRGMGTYTTGDRLLYCADDVLGGANPVGGARTSLLNI
ncbi:hypothetical protein DB29_03670 [Shouchella clausii]|nr:hypothetical protein DB29_03670 [Shouchella clausii]